MDAKVLARVAFTQLEHRRSRFAWTLTGLVLAIYLAS